MKDEALSGLLEEYSPADFDDERDWEDVLRRADGTARVVRSRTASPRPRRRRPVLLLLLLAAAGVLLILLATPAFGLRQALLDLVGRENVRFESAASAPPVVKRRFADLALGAPPSMNPQAIADATRRVVFDTRQRRRVLFVAPTRRGGFCYTLEDAFGGCQRTGGASERTPALTLTYAAGGKPGAPARISQVGGTVLDDRITQVTIEFNDGHRTDLRFIWISAPINAGFFVYAVPAGRQERARGPKALIARDKNARVIERDSSFRYWTPERPHSRPPANTPAGRRLPTRPPVPLSEPIVRASQRGATVSVGANGAALFDSTALDGEIRELLSGHAAGFGCFRITTQYGATYARGYTVAGRFADSVGLRFNNLGRLDGCEIQGSYGHRWPDRLGSHSAVEFAFNDHARRWFADRAAARDLALFVRSRRLQRIRRLRARELERQLKARYGGVIARLSLPAQRPPPRTIGYWAGPDATIFSRISTTGRRLFVEVKNGRIARHNLEHLALVF